MGLRRFGDPKRRAAGANLAAGAFADTEEEAMRSIRPRLVFAVVGLLLLTATLPASAADPEPRAWWKVLGRWFVAAIEGTSGQPARTLESAVLAEGVVRDPSGLPTATSVAPNSDPDSLDASGARDPSGH